MNALLRVRFRALIAGLTAQGRQKKKRGIGSAIMLAILYLYVIVVICGAMGMLFSALCEPYHMLGLDWLYFAMAGLMAFALSILGSVFSTQSQLYDAKDNELLLSMPLKSGYILLSRMIPLLALNLLFAGIVMIPAIVVYAIRIGVSATAILLPLVCLLSVSLLAQAVGCLLGWLLHLLLSKLNKSFASILYMVVFLGVYFFVYSKASEILNAMAVNGLQIADSMRIFGWPLYALGCGCTGDIAMLFAFIAICCACFALAYYILSVTFLRSATMYRSGGKRKRLDMSRMRVASVSEAIIRKEAKKFIGCPVYLTNMGLGLIFTVLLPVLALIFRAQVLEVLTMLELPSSVTALIICAVVAYTCSMTCISTPSVSLEGKNIWILKSMPLSARQIITAKLCFHLRVVVPVNAIAALVLALTLGCSPADVALCALTCALLGVLSGIVGMLCGLRWVRLDYISEAYPCKQSVAVVVSMFGMMGLPLVFGLLYGFLLSKFLSATAFLGITVLVLLGISALFYRAMVTWGAKKWESLN